MVCSISYTIPLSGGNLVLLNFTFLLRSLASLWEYRRVISLMNGPPDHQMQGDVFTLSYSLFIEQCVAIFTHAP